MSGSWRSQLQERGGEREAGEGESKGGGREDREGGRGRGGRERG